MSSMASMSDMSSMDGMGMDMGSDGMFRPHNQKLAQIYWYLVAAVFAFACLLSGVSVFESWSRKRTLHARSLSHPTRPQNIASQAYATTLAIFREISYPQAILISHPSWAWLTPPPLGPSLVILTYWVIITLFLTTGSIINDAYYWERIGFRAAWVSVTQVPLVFLLAGKVNFAGFFLGSSYVNINWLHRWLSRTLLVTVTIHGGFFFSEWVRADFVRMELEMMPMVKYGLGLWGVLVWTNLSSLVPIRRLSYEIFVLQHIVSASVFLWLLHTHVPAYASYNIWIAVAFVLVGRASRFFVLLYQNLSIRSKTLGPFAGKRVGHPAEMQALAGDITLITIHGVRFSWKAGQHVLLWYPTLGPLESHPFTISNISEKKQEAGSSKVELIIRARSGFTRRLYRRALSLGATSPTATVFLTGPFGSLPAWNTYETLVLISASTGASFTLPILESVLNDLCCVRRIDCLLLVRHRSHIDGYLSRLLAAASHPRSSELSLQIKIAVTGEQGGPIGEDDASMELTSLATSSSSEAPSKTWLKSQATTTERSSSSSRNVIAEPNKDYLIGPEEQDIGDTINRGSRSNYIEKADRLHYTFGRPNLANTIREPVEASAGETSVLVCGGKSLTSTVRNCLASLSDERAVHKGTGAQGIHLHVEEFGL